MEVISQNIVYFMIAIAIMVALFVWAYASNQMQKDFSTMTWVLMPVAIAINGVMGYIVGQLKLPVFLDSIGTVLVGALCGPWAGALTGALSNFVIGMLTNPTDWWPWIPVAFFIGLVAGLCANSGLFKSWWKVASTEEQEKVNKKIRPDKNSITLSENFPCPDCKMITPHFYLAHISFPFDAFCWIYPL